MSDRLKTEEISLLLRIGSAMGMFIFFQFGYLWAQNHDGFSVVYVMTAIDEWVPLIPIFILPYMAGYFFALVPFFLLRSRSDLQAAVIGAFCILVISFLCFRFFPISMEKIYATGDDFFSRLTLFQQKTDTTFNTFPSLHVSLNVFAHFVLRKHLGRTSWISLIIAVLVAVSTVFVKQHYVIDLIGGAALGVVFGLMYLRPWPIQAKILRFGFYGVKFLIAAVIIVQLNRLPLLFDSARRYLFAFLGMS